MLRICANSAQTRRFRAFAMVRFRGGATCVLTLHAQPRLLLQAAAGIISHAVLSNKQKNNNIRRNVVKRSLTLACPPIMEKKMKSQEKKVSSFSARATVASSC